MRSFFVSSLTDSSSKYVLELTSVRAPLAKPPLLPNNCPSVLQLHVKHKLNTLPFCRYWKHVWRTVVTDSTSRWLTETSSMAWWSKSSPPRTTLQPSYKTKFCHSYRYHGVFYPFVPFCCCCWRFIFFEEATNPTVIPLSLKVGFINAVKQLAVFSGRSGEC